MAAQDSKQIRIFNETFDKLERITQAVGKRKVGDTITSIVDVLGIVLSVAKPGEVLTISVGDEPNRRFIIPLQRILIPLKGSQQS